MAGSGKCVFASKRTCSKKKGQTSGYAKRCCFYKKDIIIERELRRRKNVFQNGNEWKFTDYLFIYFFANAKSLENLSKSL